MGIDPNIPDPELHQAAVLKFTLPLGRRIVSAIGAVGFLALALLSSFLVELEGSDIWIPLGFLGFGILCAAVLYFSLGGISLDAQAITYRKLGRVVRIPYDEIMEIEHRLRNHSLVVYGANNKIIVEKLMSRYPFFYSQLMERCPSQIVDSPDFPIEVRPRRWLRVFFWLFVIGGGTVLFFALRHSVILWALLVGILLIVFGALALLLLPSAYVFEREGLIVFSSLRQRVLSAEDFQLANLERVFDENTMSESSRLTLTFSTGTIILNELAVDYPLELLVSVVSDHYQAAPSKAGTG